MPCDDAQQGAQARVSSLPPCRAAIFCPRPIRLGTNTYFINFLALTVRDTHTYEKTSIPNSIDQL